MSRVSIPPYIGGALGKPLERISPQSSPTQGGGSSQEPLEQASSSPPGPPPTFPFIIPTKLTLPRRQPGRRILLLAPAFVARRRRRGSLQATTAPAPSSNDRAAEPISWPLFHRGAANSFLLVVVGGVVNIVILAGGAGLAWAADPLELGLISSFAGKEGPVSCLHGLYFLCLVMILLGRSEELVSFRSRPFLYSKKSNLNLPFGTDSPIRPACGCGGLVCCWWSA